VPDPEPANDFLDGFMDDYFAECDEHLTSVRRILLSAESRVDQALSDAALEELFRSFHSLKGLSGMVALREAEQLAHGMESYLRRLRGRTALLTEAGLDALLRGTHLLEQVIAARREKTKAPDILPAVQLLEQFAAEPDTEAPAAERPLETSPRWRVRFSPSPALAARGVNVDYVRAALKAAGRIVDAAPRVAPDGAVAFEFVVADVSDPSALEALAADGVQADVVAKGDASGSQTSDAPEATPGSGALLSVSQVVRVDLARLDDLMRMIGDLVISRARLEDSLTAIEPRVPAVEWRSVQENSLALERQLRDLREGVMRVRMVPVGEVFRRMSLVVRDLARESGKVVQLQLSGEHTEIDKLVIERMMDPVLHLVRNAVAHGIETPDERRAAGKSETATLTLSAASVGDVVTLEVADDGQGIDTEAVASRARALGIHVPDGPLEGAALLEIICAPGFSTRDAADRVAGRGVGMAVVHGAVRELGGTLTLDTSLGEGTRFLIELPLTLAITDAIIATVGPQKFAIPQGTVREVIELDPALVRAVENHELAPYRGGVLPLMRLARVFGLPAAQRRVLHVFVIGQGISAMGLVVDRIEGQREIVVRPITDPLVKVPGVTGATDLGNGRVVLILDPSRIAAAAPRSQPARAS
jgi:two-component system chemotaxis sensor kinase CheA